MCPSRSRYPGLGAFLHRVITSVNPRSSLKARLGLVIGTIALVVSLLGNLAVGYTTRLQVQTDVGHSLSYLSSQIAQKLDEGMFERYQEIQQFSSYAEIANPRNSLDQKRSLLELLQRTFPDYSWIGLTDPTGNVLVSTGQLLENKDVSQRPWFQQGKIGAYVGDVHEAVLLAKLLPNAETEPIRFVDVAFPVRLQDGKLLGVLGAHLSWAWAKQISDTLLQPTQRNLQVEVFIVDTASKVLLPTPEHDQFLHLKTIQAAQQGLNDYAIETWADGNSYFTGFAATTGYQDYPGLGWVVLTRQRTDTAVASIQQLQTQVFHFNLLLGILFAIAGWLVAHHLTRPLLAIAAAANHIHDGYPASRLPALRGRDEVARLSRSLSHLVDTLLKTNQQLESEIEERRRAEARIQLALQEKEVLLAEIHHRVKNNLQVINSLLRLKARGVQDPQLLDAFQQSQDRIEVMALIHEKLYQSDNFSQVDFSQYVHDLTTELFRAYRVNTTAIAMQVKVNAVALSLDLAIPCGLIINELVTNALKYAFPSGNSGEITISLTQQEPDSYTLMVQDNGIGLPEQVNNQPPQTLGLKLVHILTQQLRGTVSVDRHRGTTFVIKFAAPTTHEAERQR
jgi:two-component sensor histidine kinase/HAMP domain-containing protein